VTTDRVSYDVMTLAAAMLPLLKDQSRITRTDEDTQATEIMARAIGRVERECGIAIAPQEWTWTPRAIGTPAVWNATTEWRLSEVPVRGVAGMTAEDAAGVAFVDFDLVGNREQGAFAELHVTRPAGVQAGDVFTIEAGWDDPADMPAELRDTLVRYAASLWEFREAWATTNVDTVPEWVTAALGVFWVPRV
jgi:uncharacterized phiE125 gp8 family phage protein